MLLFPLILLFGLWATPASAQVWPNKPASFGTVLDCPFNIKPTPSRDPAGCGIENFYNAGSIVTDSTAPVSPPNTYRSRLEAGASGGGTQLNYVTPSTYREMYVGVKWRTNPAFIGKTGAGNKLMFLRGPVSNGVLMMYGRGTIGFSHNSGNVNNDHTCALDLGLQCNPNVGSGTVSISSSTVRTGGYALRVNPTTTATGLYRVGCFTAAGGRDTACSVATLYTRFYFRYATKPASGSEIIYQARTSGDAVKFSLRINSSGNLLAYDSAGSLLATGSTALAQDTWYRIEPMVGTGASANWAVQLNGAAEISGSGASLNASNNGRLFLGKTTDVSGQSVDFFYDDFSLDDSTYPGEGKIVRLIPNANGSTMAWTTGTGSSNYLEVDDVPMGTASYVKNTGAANEVALFDLTDSSTAGISGTIHAIRPEIQARLDATGTSAFSLRTRSGTTNTDLATVALTTGGAYISTTYATDPDTAGAWSTAAIDALEVGGIETAAVSTRLQDAHVYVEYTEAVASSNGSLMLMGVGR